MNKVLLQLLSRKLLSTVAAISAIVALLITMALINTQLLIENKELLGLAIISIAGLGGFTSKLQADLDAKANDNDL